MKSEVEKFFKPPVVQETYLGHRASKVLRFFKVTEVFASFSKDGSTKVGALALGKHLNIISGGWNGFPRGVNDDLPERHERPAKYDWVSHAEANLVAQATLTGSSLEGTMILVQPLFPCTNCANLIIQSGISHVFAPRSTHEPWITQEQVSMRKFKEAGVKVTYVRKAGEDWIVDK